MERNHSYSPIIYEDYPRGLRDAIREEFDLFSGTNKLTSTLGKYGDISVMIESKTGELITESWLRDFYTKKKDHKPLKIKIFTSILNAFDYVYIKENKKWEKAEGEHSQFKKILSVVSPLISFSPILRSYVGLYKYFLCPRDNPNYHDPYENEMEIFDDCSVKIYNPFNEKTYYGIAIIRQQILQIVSPDIQNGSIGGIGNILNFTVNEYRRKAILFPGLSISFDSNNLPTFGSALLCVDLQLTKHSPLISAYFKRFSQGPSFSCPSPKDVASLIAECEM